LVGVYLTHFSFLFSVLHYYLHFCWSETVKSF
jgi:hypothetical protein